MAHGAHIAGNALSNVRLVASFLVQHSDGNSLVMAEVAVRMRVVIEERRRRRGRRSRSSCCSCTGGILSYALLCRRAAGAACLVACELGNRLPLAAARTQALCARMRAQTHAKAALCERGIISDAYALIVLLSICTLTMVELDMLSAAVGQPLTSLQKAEQQQHVSAYCMLRTVLTHSVQVVAWH